MKLVGQNNGFAVYFDCDKQVYHLYKDGNILIAGKTKYSEVKTYLE
jgi:hypothetical protein